MNSIASRWHGNRCLYPVCLHQWPCPNQKCSGHNVRCYQPHDWCTPRIRASLESTRLRYLPCLDAHWSLSVFLGRHTSSVKAHVKNHPDNYHLFSGNTEWVRELWSNYTKAVGFLEGKVDETGLIDITGLRDWARQGGGGHNAEGNALLYQVWEAISLTCCAED